MKKYFILMAAFAILFSCAKEEKGPEADDVVVDNQEEPTVTEGVTQFTATIPETKTYLGDPSGEAGSRSWPNYWSAGDVININGENSEALTSGDDYVGKKAATFTVSNSVAPVGGKFFALYPGSALVANSWDSSAKTASINIPSAQTWVAGSYDPAAYIMVGSSETATLSFSPMMGLIQLTTTAPASGTLYIKSIAVEPVGDEQMSGTFTTDYSAIEDTDAGPSSVTISPASGTLAFGSVFTFAIPAQNYASGVRFRITAVPNTDGTGTEQTMVFAKQSAFDVAASTLYPLTAPAFKESAITLSCPFKTSSSLGLAWSGASASDQKNFKKSWRLAVYSDESCNSLVVQHDIPADPDKSGVWSGMSANGNPHFMVGGLSAGTTYYCKVTDIQANMSSAVFSVATDPFTVVEASSPVGNTLVAEDFSEFGWGPAYLGGVAAANRYAGWSPVSGQSSNVSLAAPAGVVTTGYYKAYNYSSNNLPTNFNYATAPRFNAGWGYCYQGDAFNGYPQAGHLRMGGANANRVFMVCPALSGITSGKFATVDVTVKVAHMEQAAVTSNPEFAVFVESGLTLSNASQRMYSGATLNRRYPVVLTKYGHQSDVLTFRVNGLQSTDHLMVGAYNNVNEHNRYTLYSIKVEKISESDTETFDITDPETLELFRSRVAGGDTSLDGNVVNDINASSVASTWVPIDGYTGTLEGNNKTISGLTQPFFDNLQGTVQNLTLNSNINRTTDEECTAIFAQYLNGTITDCISMGSVIFQPSTPVTNATRYVAGMVGKVDSGSLTRCTNQASVSVPHNAQTNDMIIEVGGVVGRINSTTACSYLHNVHDPDVSNSGKVSVSVIHANATERECRIGGVCAHVTNDATAIDNFTNSGDVEYSGTSYGPLKIGGIIGYQRKAASNCINSGSVTVTSSASVTKGGLYLGGVIAYHTTAGTVSSCSNSGAISNAGSTTADDIDVGGLFGKTTRAISSSYNTGTVENSGASGVDVCLGGISGNATNTYTSCYNTNSVSNAETGTGTILYIGGLNGYSNGCTYTSVCYNTGSVSNAATATSDAIGVKMGGLAGHAVNKNIFSSSSSNSCNYNNGTLSETSSTPSVAVGGICGYADNNETSFAYAQNRSLGTITMGGSHSNTLAGGILGSTSVSLALSACNNAGAINFTSCTVVNVRAGGIVGSITDSAIPSISGADSNNWTTNSGPIKFTTCSISGQLAAGGIFGTWENANTATIQYCRNSGSITTNTQSTSSEDICTATMGAYSYVAGIGTCTSSDGAGKTFTYCQNTGDIKIFTSSRTRIGGITAMCKIAPSYCDVDADITLGWNRDCDNKNYIGGIVGYYNSGNNSETFTNLYYYGTIDATGLVHNNNRQLTCGFINVNPGTNAVTSNWTNCKIGGTIKNSVNTGYENGGLFTGHNISNTTPSNRPTIGTCIGCQILSGTNVYRAGNNLITADNPKSKWLIGNNGPYENVTVTGISCVQSISPNTPFSPAHPARN